MKNVRKTASVLLLCLAILLGGCGADSNVLQPSTTPKTSTEPTASTEVKEPVEIVYTCWGDASEKKAVEATLENFQKNYDWIKVKSIIIPNSEYDTKITTMVSANETIDVAQLESATIAYPLAEQGKLLNLTEMLTTDPNVNMDSFIPVSYYKMDKDTIIGLGQGMENFLMFYNKDIFSEAGIETPPSNADQAWDWDKFIEISKKLTIDNSGKKASEAGFDPNNITQYGVSIPKWWGSWGNFIYSNGGDYITDDGKFGLSQPAAIEAFQKLADLSNVHHVAPTPTAEKGMPGMEVALLTKKVAMVVEGQWCCLQLGDANVNFGVGVLPKMKEMKTQSVTAMNSIFKDTKYKEASWELVKYFNDPSQGISLYSTGNLMPISKDWLTKPELLDQWARNNPAHPEEYVEAAIGSLLNNSVPPPTGTIKNFNKIMDIVEPALDKVWMGEETAEKALKECEEKVQSLLQGKREF